VTCLGDGYTVHLEWHKSYLSSQDWSLFYNLYWSSNQRDVFSEGPKFVVAPDLPTVDLSGNFRPGDIYYFAVKPTAHENNTLLFSQLPEAAQGLRLYPEDSLRENITADALVIPINDAALFPPTGIIQIGAELISYSSVDYLDNNLLVSERGLYGYEPRIHTVDGYDGIRTYSNPFVRIWKGFEDQNNAIGVEEIKFEQQYARTNADGYRERTDILTGSANLDVVDAENAGFPAFDQAGWDRTYLPDYLSGKCVGTYFGGEYGCADDDETEGPLRGLGVQDHMLMREEYLLEITGEPVMLLKRMWKGKQSQHYDSARENPVYRGLDNFGTSLVTGYEQFFNPRRSDGKILVRFGPTKEDFKREESGIENVFIPNCWTIVIPSIQDGDVIIRFNSDGSEEWRYEVLDVERNRTLLHESGSQKFTAVRIRKTDPIYQWRAIRDTSNLPSEILTSIGSVAGPGGIPPHMHRVVVTSDITSINQINQTTSIEQGHNHPIENGVIITRIGHGHVIIL
jgi:hypothetical protein